MRRPSVLLLDVMGTLVREPFFHDVPVLLGLPLEELLAAKHPTSWIAFEKGEIEEAEYLRQFFRDGRPVDGAALRECLLAGYRWLPGAEELLADLAAAGHEVHAFSNYPVWYERLDGKLGLSRYLRWTFVSCRTGLRKPDPAAYRHALATLGCAPAQCVFVDDRQQNVEAADALGLDALLHVDALSTRRALARRGLLAD